MQLRNFRKYILFLLDAVSILLAFLLAYYLRFNLLISSWPLKTIPDLVLYSRVIIFIIAAWLIIYKLQGLYDKRFSNIFDEIVMILGGNLIGLFVLFGMLFLFQEFWVSRQVVVFVFIINVLCMSFFRFILDFLLGFLPSKKIEVLIVGTGEIAQVLAEKIMGNPHLGYKIFGFIGGDPQDFGKTYPNIPVLGASSEIKEIIKTNSIDEIMFADPNMESKKVLDLIMELETYGIKVKIVPGLLELMASRVDTDVIAGIPLIDIRKIGLSGFNSFLKRCIDLIFSFVGLILLVPLFVIISVLIKIDSKGPIFFLQERVGKDGKKFMVYKFRSMVSNAEELLSELQDKSEAEGHIFKIKKDPRITRVGGFIRRLSIDELPQLFNVCKGEMSLVGPRPPIPREVEKYNSWQLKRLRIAPGITGLWQVSGRSLLPFDDMVRLDIYYIENWSLWLDIKILFRTIPAVLTASGAY